MTEFEELKESSEVNIYQDSLRATSKKTLNYKTSGHDKNTFILILKMDVQPRYIGLATEKMLPRSKEIRINDERENYTDTERTFKKDQYREL